MSSTPSHQTKPKICSNSCSSSWCSSSIPNRCPPMRRSTWQSASSTTVSIGTPGWPTHVRRQTLHPRQPPRDAPPFYRRPPPAHRPFKEAFGRCFGGDVALAREVPCFPCSLGGTGNRRTVTLHSLVSGTRMGFERESVVLWSLHSDSA